MLVAPPEPSSAIADPPTIEHVFEGPHWYRTRVRRFGPLLAMIAPAVLGAIALIALEVFDGKVSGAIGLTTGICAAPGLLAIGAPFASTSTYPVGIAISVALWLLVGTFGARIATWNPVATFTDFWRAYRWLAAGVWVGALGALGGAALVLDRSLL